MHRGVLAEVALEADSLDAPVARMETLDRSPGPVAGAIVDDDDLKRARIALQDGDRLLHDLLNCSFLVEDGHDKRHVGAIVLGEIG